jgi:hypothetical protein
MGGGIFIIFLILVAIVGPHLVQNPDAYHANLINPTFSRPNGPYGGISLAHLVLDFHGPCGPLAVDETGVCVLSADVGHPWPG